MTPFPTTHKFSLYPALGVTLGGALLCLWRAWCEFPMYSWNEARLAPAFALRHGVNPYPQLGEGPLSTWIYGPSGIFVNLPATFASSALGAVQIACLVNFLILIAPLAWVFFSSKEVPAPDRFLRWFALGLAILLIPRPNLVLQVADHTAIAFGIVSCWFLTRTSVPTALDLSIAAGGAVIAVWAKQIEVFLIAAQLLYLCRCAPWSVIIRYCGWLFFLGLLATAAVIAKFGWDNLWLNLVTIPNRLSWTEDLAGRIAMRRWSLVAQFALPLAGLLWLRLTRNWPRTESPGGRFFLITIFAYLALIPIGLAAFLKVGGDTNLFHSWDYLLPGCLLAWITSRKISAGALPFWFFGLTLFGLGLRHEDLLSIPKAPYAAHFEAAERLIADHPHRLWFPRNPIITFYADDQLWHSEDGVQTRFLANYGLKEADFRRYLPPQLEGVVYPSIVEWPFSLPLLSEFNHSSRSAYWTLHTREK